METNRYHRQTLLPDIGIEGMHSIAATHVAIIGCGALGSVSAEMLARAGIGEITIIDRDLVELTNLQRQILFTESDVHNRIPKAEAARQAIATFNSDITVNAIVDDFNHTNALSLIGDAAILIDGLDNFETRYLLNDISVRHQLPYIYGGAVATNGMTATFIPSLFETPCLRCLFENPPPPGSTPTCDTAGVLGSVVSLIANYQAIEVLKIAIGRVDLVNPDLLTLDPWANTIRSMKLRSAKNPNCPCCGQANYEYLEGHATSDTTSLCGRNSVQITPANSDSIIDISVIATHLSAFGEVNLNPYLLRVEINDGGSEYEITLFPNGRAIISGTSDPTIARQVYARYIGS